MIILSVKKNNVKSIATILMDKHDIETLLDWW
jgi:hypothetical protein